MQLGGVTGSWAQQAAIIGGLLCFGAAARAQTLTILTSPSAMAITTAIAGLPPTSKTSNPTNYTITGKNAKTYKITARLSAAMPPGVTLEITMTAPTGAVALGPVTLDATTRDVVSNIINKTAEVQQITYVLSATAAAGVVTPQNRVVTFTLTQTP